MKASNVAIFSATKGECARGLERAAAAASVSPGGAHPGPRTTGTRPATTFKPPANFATASGKVTSKSGSKIDVQAVTFSVTKGKVTTKTGPKTVDVSKSTKYSKSDESGPVPSRSVSRDRDWPPTASGPEAPRRL